MLIPAPPLQGAGEVANMEHRQCHCIRALKSLKLEARDSFSWLGEPTVFALGLVSLHLM